MMSANKLSGCNTLQYKAIRKNYYHIVLSFEQVLTKLTALCFEKELVSTNERDDPRQPLYDRSEALLTRILRKVELHQKWYYVFLTVLGEFPELSDIKLSIESSYASEEGSQFASLPRRRISRPEDSGISRRHSESDLAHSKNVHPTDLDSGVSGVAVYSTFKNGDAIENVPEEEEVSVNDKQPRLLINSKKNEDGVSATSNSVAVSSEGVHSLAGKPIMFTAPKSPLAGNYRPPVSVEARGERTSQVMLQSHDKLNISSNDRGTDSKYLRSEKKQLEEKIGKLQQTVDEYSKTIEDLGEEVSERDAVIENLEKELNEKDGIVKELVKDKADQERNIEIIKAEHEREKKGIEEVHEKKIEQLQNRILELECKERDALIKLEKVKVELMTARLDKEIALSQLREKYYNEEKAKMELKILLEEEKTQRAQEATEHANILRSVSEDKERKAKDEAQHAEEKEKMARDEAQRARDENEQSKGLLEVERDLREKADKERRISAVQIKELEKKIQDLTLKKK